MIVFWFALAIILVDQGTKLLARAHLRTGGPLEVLPGFFDLTYVQNSGAAFGIFRGMTLWLALFSIVMLVMLILFRHHFLTDAFSSHLALGLITGGIVGNLIDRLRWDYVIDFLDFYWKQSHFPAFNVADSAICLGVGLYLLQQSRHASTLRASELEARNE